MEHEPKMELLAKGTRDLLRELVAAELDRRVAAIDDIVVSGYGSFIGKRAEDNAAKLRAAIVELVLSPLADLERELAAEPVKPADPAVKVAV